MVAGFMRQVGARAAVPEGWNEWASLCVEMDWGETHRMEEATGGKERTMCVDVWSPSFSHLSWSTGE